MNIFHFSESHDMNLRHIDAVATFQGYVRRKTVLKEGKKPAVSYSFCNHFKYITIIIFLKSFKS